MKDPGHSASQAAPVDQSGDVSAALAALQQSGADKFDPVHVHYLQVLAKRAATQQGRVKHLLDNKLALALATFKERLERARIDAKGCIAEIAPQHLNAAAELQPLLDAGDFKGVRHFIASLKTRVPRASLGDLARQMAQHAPEQTDAGFKGIVDGLAGLRPELKATRYFRNTWSRLSVEKRVVQALHQAPKNAGPINSHSLVLRSLALMRDISPDYLNQFASYVDTLISLDQGDQVKAVSSKKAADGNHSEKAKGRRTTRKPS